MVYSVKLQLSTIGSWRVYSLLVPKKTSSSPKLEEEIGSHSSEVLRETNRVDLEMEALDEAAKKPEHVHFSKMVKLNVGGHLFSTSLATLTKDSGDLK